jgi:hypothetical protein
MLLKMVSTLSSGVSPMLVVELRNGRDLVNMQKIA